MKNAAIISILLISILNSIGYAHSSRLEIDQVIQQKLPHAVVSIFVKNARTGQVIYSKNADTLLTPASSTKLFTAAAALYYLPQDYRFKTQLSQNAHNYYLTFTGAPDFTTADLLHLLSALKNSGTHVISGDIILDISRFKQPYYPAGISYEDLGWYYAAPESALILNENAADFDFITGKELGEPVKITAKLPNNGLNISYDVVTVDEETEKNHCALQVEIMPKNTVHLSGCLAINADPITMTLAIPDPVLLAKEAIYQYLKDNHIDFQGQVTIGKTPAGTMVLSSIESANLNQLISFMLKNSDNLYAGSFTRLLGYLMTGEGSTQQGAFAIKKIISEHTQVDLNQLHLFDGMGTRYNLISSRQIVNLLVDLYHEKNMQFINMLPQAGVSGTLQNRMQKNELNKIVFAKTGTMHDITSLSGYIVKPDADVFVFSIIMNGKIN